jgi:chemotaxis protein MotB
MRIPSFIFSASLILLSSCIVSKKKYDDMLAQKVKAEGELGETSRKLEKTEADLKDLTEKAEQLKKDTASLGDAVRSNLQKLDDLGKEYAQLNTFYKNLVSSSGKMNRELAQQQEQLLAIQANLDKTRHLNDSLSASLSEREKKVNELEEILASKDKAVNDLKARISNALLNFKENDLTVNVKNGKVYVSLSEQLLFASGSIVVDKKGQQALGQLAQAIKDQTDIHIMVEGHTDNVPISKKSAYMEDNWDLSVMRATAITKILTRGGVKPGQITASGKGEYSPLAPNDNPASRQKNRRTEIIITPDLDELFKILEAN